MDLTLHIIAKNISTSIQFTRSLFTVLSLIDSSYSYDPNVLTFYVFFRAFIVPNSAFYSVVLSSLQEFKRVSKESTIFFILN